MGDELDEPVRLPDGEALPAHRFRELVGVADAASDMVRAAAAAIDHGVGEGGIGQRQADEGIAPVDHRRGDGLAQGFRAVVVRIQLVVLAPDLEFLKLAEIGVKDIFWLRADGLNDMGLMQPIISASMLTKLFR